MPVIIPHSPTSIRVRALMRSITTLGGVKKVTGFDNLPAYGRKVLLLQRDVFGRWQVVAETTTDSNGDYSFAVNAGDNDRFIVVGVGNDYFSEYSRALGSMRAG